MVGKYFTGDNFEFKMTSDCDKALLTAIELIVGAKYEDFHTYAEVEKDGVKELVFFTDDPPYEFKDVEKLKVPKWFNANSAANMVEDWLKSLDWTNVENEFAHDDGGTHQGYTIWIDSLWGIIFKIKPAYLYYSK